MFFMDLFVHHYVLQLFGPTKNKKEKYSNNDYIFLPADNYLFEGGKNKIKITNTKGRPFEVKMVNGDIKKLGEIVFLKLMGWLIWAKLFYQFMKQNLMVLKK